MNTIQKKDIFGVTRDIFVNTNIIRVHLVNAKCVIMNIDQIIWQTQDDAQKNDFEILITNNLTDTNQKLHLIRGSKESLEKFAEAIGISTSIF